MQNYLPWGRTYKLFPTADNSPRLTNFLSCLGRKVNLFLSRFKVSIFSQHDSSTGMEVSLLLVTSSTLSSERFPIPTKKKDFYSNKVCHKLGYYGTEKNDT